MALHGNDLALDALCVRQISALKILFRRNPGSMAGPRAQLDGRVLSALVPLSRYQPQEDAKPVLPRPLPLQLYPRPRRDAVAPVYRSGAADVGDGFSAQHRLVPRFQARAR